MSFNKTNEELKTMMSLHIANGKGMRELRKQGSERDAFYYYLKHERDWLESDLLKLVPKNFLSSQLGLSV